MPHDIEKLPRTLVRMTKTVRTFVFRSTRRTGVGAGFTSSTTIYEALSLAPCSAALDSFCSLMNFLREELTVRYSRASLYSRGMSLFFTAFLMTRQAAFGRK